VVQHFAGGSRRGTWRWFGFALASVVVGVLVLSTLVVLVNSRDDDIPSANPDIHQRYAGRLFTGAGQPLVSRVDLKLRSVEDHPIEVTTDEDGRFCVTFPQEPELGIMSPQRIVSDLPVDPRFIGRNGHALLAKVRAGDGDHEPQPARLPILVRPDDSATTTINNNYSVAAWKPSADQSSTCAPFRKPAPWYRYQGAWSTWQALTLLALPLIAWLLLYCGLRYPPIRLLVRAGIAGLVVSAVLTPVLLDIPRGERYTPNPPWLYDANSG
jgi:hypothetical protein